MEIIKSENKYLDSFYDFTLVEGDKKLHIDYAGVMDTYWLMEDGKKLKPWEDSEIVFEITKEDYEIYELFDILYNEVVSGYPNGMDKDFKNTQEYKKLVDNGSITWISDNGPEEYEDRVVISKEADSIKLRFIRNPLTDKFELKSPWYISVRFRNDGSKYRYFHTSFANLYNKIQGIDPDSEYHQYHIEEYEYLQRKNSRVK